MRIDAIIGGIFLVCHLIMTANLEENLNNFIYQEITIIMALTGWFFVGRFLYIIFKNSR